MERSCVHFRNKLPSSSTTTNREFAPGGYTALAIFDSFAHCDSPEFCGSILRRRSLVFINPVDLAINTNQQNSVEVNNRPYLLPLLLPEALPLFLSNSLGIWGLLSRRLPPISCSWCHYVLRRSTIYRVVGAWAAAPSRSNENLSASSSHPRPSLLPVDVDAAS